jgi:hypothetical protein
MLSLVALSNSAVELTLDSLRARLDQIYTRHFVPPREQGTFIIDGEVKDVQFLIQSSIDAAKELFMLNSVPAPYTKFSDFHRRISDPALRTTAAAQKCWLSVDLVRRYTTDDEAYGFISRVIAHLAPMDTAALVDPDKAVTIPFDDNVRRKLASGARVFTTQ